MPSYFNEFKQTRRIYYVGKEGWEVIYYPNGEISKPHRMGKEANDQLKILVRFDNTLAKAVQNESEFRELRYKISGLGYDFMEFAKKTYDDKMKPLEIRDYILAFEREHWLQWRG